MREEAEAVLAPQFNDMLALCAQPFLQPIYDLEVPHMAFGRVALLGDAAFVARPHVGAGVAKAADDALTLADALEAGEIEGGLKQFEAARLPVGNKIIERARRLGAYVQADLKTQAERVYAALHRKPEAVLAETAMMDF
jgi:2-polyprenyl-6-methoxyphenol hydroxylase-like FAD-dependent oxidoreductase